MSRDALVGIDQLVPLFDGRLVPYVNLDNAASTPAFRSVVETIEEAGAGVDRQIVSSLPGETARFRVTGLVPRDVPTLLERPLCWSVADLVTPR